LEKVLVKKCTKNDRVYETLNHDKFSMKECRKFGLS
jgi:hypothetical protein